MSSNTRKQNIQTEVYQMVEVGFVETPLARSYDILNLAAVLINLTATILFTYADIASRHPLLLHYMEAVTVAFFAIDYVLRLWTAPVGHPHDSSGKAVAKYAFSFSGIVDLISFLPYYLPVFFPSGTAAFRLFRVLRLFRLFRVNRYNDSLSAITDVLRKKRQQLLSSLAIILVLMIFSSLCMYSVEHDAQPDVFTNAFSGIWWSASTLLTVGYGDIYPITTAGKVLGIIITFLGVGMVAIPTGIISAGFVEQYQQISEQGRPNDNVDLTFLRLRLQRDDSWVGRRVSTLSLPDDMNLAVIQRGRETILPHDDAVLQAGDMLLLGAESFREDWNPVLQEVTLPKEHPWIGTQIQDLDISRLTYVVLVRRGRDILTPAASLTLRQGDTVVLYSKKHISGADEIVIDE